MTDIPTGSNSSRPSPAPSQGRIGYVMTHYPKLAQTFIRSEIEGLERRGFTVVPMAMNRSEESDIADPASRAEMERTLYLKDGGASGAAQALSAALGAGLGPTISELRRAARFGGWELRSKLWGGFHLAEALVVWQHCVDNDIRHLHAQFAGSTATIAALAARIGTALTPERPWTTSISIHGELDFRNEEQTDLRSKLREASFMVVVSDYLRAQAMRVTDPVDWHKIHVVRVGIDPDLFAPRDAEPGGERVVPRVCTVGRLSSEKGQIVLLEAAAVLVARGVEVGVDVVGDGPMAADLRAAVQRLGVGSSVTFHGELPPTAVAAMLRETDIFCLPSFLEGIPVSIMEAMSVGVPVIASALMGIPELVVDGVTGLAVTPGRADLMADAIERCLGDADLRRSMVEAGRERVRALHDLDTNLDQMAGLFSAVV